MAYGNLHEKSTGARNSAKRLPVGTFKARRLTDHVQQNYLVDDAKAKKNDICWNQETKTANSKISLLGFIIVLSVWHLTSKKMAMVSS